MRINLKNKRALIGGSSKGLGYAVAKQLATCGAEVTLVSRNETLLKKNIIELKELTGFDHNYLVVDYNDSVAYKKNIDKLGVQLETTKERILIIFGRCKKVLSFQTINFFQWRRVLQNYVFEFHFNESVEVFNPFALVTISKKHDALLTHDFTKSRIQLIVTI